ncbi:RHS repeat-associated core domain-containing protein [Schleiferia thermophila]|uniref:RHS repeat-associated core domain-containing protein n=1 Tax=Schleiferia thermophila TaxID=884107 RepID=UPI0021AB3523|nr:RHS repeat-associated core domain-containing protein [Schleiferia thermophila]
MSQTRTPNSTGFSTPYRFNAKELDSESGLFYYGARYYHPVVSKWLSVDPMAGAAPGWSPYRAFFCNPVYWVDPDGLFESTDVTKNEDGSYTVVGAKDDGDNNIYVRGADGKRTGEVIGTTMQPTDFMLTNDKTGEFKGHANVTFRLDKLTVTGTVKPNKYTTATIYNADAQRLLDWGQELFSEEIKRQSPATFYGALQILREMSANGGPLDFKVSLGADKYTAIKAGNTADGKPIITTLRAVGNITFGANMRSTKPFTMGADWYYKQVMPEVGKYNQKANQGTGYNSGFPYYGEHTYSGSYIYYGYFGSFYKK